MWLIYGMLAQCCIALEGVIDKITMVQHNRQIDPIICSFVRNLFFYGALLVLATSGIFGGVQFFFHPLLLIMAVLQVCSSLIYNYFLEYQEISRYRAISYLFPFIYIATETVLFHEYFSGVFWGAGAILLVGTIIISFDFSSELSSIRRRSVFSLKEWGFLLIECVVGGGWLFTFRYFSLRENISETSFFVSSWCWVILAFFLLLWQQKKLRELWLARHHFQFFAGTFFSKSIDAVSSVFYLQAISLQSISHVVLLDSFAPFFTLLIALFLSLFGVRVEEDTRFRAIIGKLGGMFFLGLGGTLLWKTTA